MYTTMPFGKKAKINVGEWIYSWHILVRVFKKLVRQLDLWVREGRSDPFLGNECK